MEMRILKGYANTSIGQMHYRQVGKGKNLVLFHRTQTCSETFEPLMRLLAPHGFSVIAVDSPGFGMSPWLPVGFTIPDIGKVMLELLDALGVRKASLFGHYTGASISCEIAATAPARVEKLILSNPVNYNAEERRERLARFPRIAAKDDGSHLKEIWNALSTSQIAPPEMDIDLDLRHRAFVWRLQAETRLLEFPAAVFGYDMGSRLSKIKAPTLVLAGEFDPMRDAVEPTARAIKGALYQVIPGATRWVERQRLEDLARIIRSFILDSQI